MPTPPQSYREIPLTQSQCAKVSLEDFHHLSQHKWYASWDKTTSSFYARRAERINGKQRWISMHREILGLKRGDPRTGDHINHDTLDNQRENLRIATRYENRLNQRVRPGSRTGFKGVTRNGSGYMAEIRANGKRIYLGQRKTAEAAYALYCEAALHLHGEFAHL